MITLEQYIEAYQRKHSKLNIKKKDYSGMVSACVLESADSTTPRKLGKAERQSSKGKCKAVSKQIKTDMEERRLGIKAMAQRNHNMHMRVHNKTEITEGQRMRYQCDAIEKFRAELKAAADARRPSSNTPLEWKNKCRKWDNMIEDRLVNQPNYNDTMTVEDTAAMIIANAKTASHLKRSLALTLCQ